MKVAIDPSELNANGEQLEELFRHYKLYLLLGSLGSIVVLVLVMVDFLQHGLRPGIQTILSYPIVVSTMAFDIYTRLRRHVTRMRDLVEKLPEQST